MYKQCYFNFIYMPFFKQSFDIALSFMTIIISFVQTTDVRFASLTSHLGRKCDNLNTSGADAINICGLLV